MRDTTPRLLRETEFSRLVGIPLPTLRADRIRDRRIPYLKLGRSVYYDLDRAGAALRALEIGGMAPRRG